MCTYKTCRVPQFSQSSMNIDSRTHSSLPTILTTNIYFYIVCFGFLTFYFFFSLNAISISSIFFPFSSSHILTKNESIWLTLFKYTTSNTILYTHFLWLTMNFSMYVIGKISFASIFIIHFLTQNAKVYKRKTMLRLKKNDLSKETILVCFTKYI